MLSILDPDDLPGGHDPMSCPACLAAADICAFHTGMAAGWDLLVTRLVPEVW
jgi:hypothetical protein